MLIIDGEKSEKGPQRRRANDGRPLHCCCVCGNLSTWGKDWSCYASYKDMDDGVPYPKFCSDACRDSGGVTAERISEDMARKAKNAEWREPAIVYREATQREKYAAAQYEQHHKSKIHDLQ